MASPRGPGPGEDGGGRPQPPGRRARCYTAVVLRRGELQAGHHGEVKASAPLGAEGRAGRSGHPLPVTADSTVRNHGGISTGCRAKGPPVDSISRTPTPDFNRGKGRYRSTALGLSMNVKKVVAPTAPNRVAFSSADGRAPGPQRHKTTSYNTPPPNGSPPPGGPPVELRGASSHRTHSDPHPRAAVLFCFLTPGRLPRYAVFEKVLRRAKVPADEWPTYHIFQCALWEFRRGLRQECGR